MPYAIRQRQRRDGTKHRRHSARRRTGADDAAGGPLRLRRQGQGAADNGAGVAALLEVLRALKAGAPPTRSVMALFSDGEEAGLLGACAFASDGPRLQQIGLVVNLEARGTRGPSIMFETSQQSEELVQLFARASAHPVSNSAMGAVYDALPNDTDFTVFKRAGYRAQFCVH